MVPSDNSGRSIDKRTAAGGGGGGWLTYHSRRNRLTGLSELHFSRAVGHIHLLMDGKENLVAIKRTIVVEESMQGLEMCYPETVYKM